MLVVIAILKYVVSLKFYHIGLPGKHFYTLDSSVILSGKALAVLKARSI